VPLKSLVNYVLAVVCRNRLSTDATWVLADAARPSQVVIRLSTNVRELGP
jgi:hypothetical protein